MSDNNTCGDFGGRTKQGDPCSQPGDGRCWRHQNDEQSGRSRAGVRDQYNPERIAKAIMASNGNLTRAAKTIGCSRTTLYRYLEKFDQVAEAREEAREEFIDLAETKLRGLVNDGDFSAIRFVLRCWGKPRGWSEKQEIDLTSGDEKISGPIVYLPDNGRVDGD